MSANFAVNKIWHLIYHKSIWHSEFWLFNSSKYKDFHLILLLWIKLGKVEFVYVWKDCVSFVIHQNAPGSESNSSWLVTRFNLKSEKDPASMECTILLYQIHLSATGFCDLDCSQVWYLHQPEVAFAFSCLITHRTELFVVPRLLQAESQDRRI